MLITIPRRSRTPDSARRYLCLAVDVQGYAGTNDVRQAEIQRDLIDLLDLAAARTGLRRRKWIQQPKGDEELALVPPDEPLGRVVGEFCLTLAAVVRRYNLTRAPMTSLRLRLGLDDGPVDLSRNGFAGRAVIGASRLVNAEPVRSALRDTDLAVIMSAGVYRDWVHSGRSAVPPDMCRPVAVAEKEHIVDAWLWLPETVAES